MRVKKGWNCIGQSKPFCFLARFERRRFGEIRFPRFLDSPSALSWRSLSVYREGAACRFACSDHSDSPPPPKDVLAVAARKHSASRTCFIQAQTERPVRAVPPLHAAGLSQRDNRYRQKKPGFPPVSCEH